MEYDHGVHITKHLYEMSPLEKAISDFEAKARAHFSKPNVTPKNETPQQKAQ